MFKKHPLFIVLAIYLFMALTTLCYWSVFNTHPMTGDEPHYLIMSQGFLNSGAIEQTQPYLDEFNSRTIVKAGLAPPGTIPDIYNTHAFQGPNGLYNYHNLGLPLILAPAMLLGGVMGAKIMLVLLGALAVVLAWKLSGLLTQDSSVRFYATLATSSTSVVVLGANQIYPDLLAGIVCLAGVYWFLTLDRGLGVWKNACYALAIALLPWLQIKFAVASVLIMVAVALKLLAGRDYRSLAVMAVIYAISGFTLLGYNHYAFGNYLGPYTAGHAEFSLTSLMTFLGLQLDQNQGLFLNNPVTLVGVAFLGTFFAYDRKTALLVVLIYLSLIGPSALHTNWYGGVSFSGRFNWTAAMVFILPVLFGLVTLARLSPKAFRVVIVLSLLLQVYFYAEYVFANVDILRREPATPLAVYSVFFSPIHNWLPAFYNVDWAYRYPPNAAWLLLVILLAGAGLSRSEKLKARLANALIAGGVVIFISGFTFKEGESGHHILAKDLPGLTGQVAGDSRVVKAGVDLANFATFGPYLLLNSGAYTAHVELLSTAPPEQALGRLEVVDAMTGKVLATQPLQGTAGQAHTVEVEFHINTWNPRRYEFRNYWQGTADLEIRALDVQRLSNAK